MQNFQVIKSLGKYTPPLAPLNNMLSDQCPNTIGEGAFSQVFKVKRISDGQEYALKKVRNSINKKNFSPSQRAS